jgi:DNA-binding beta-propeller fold protein YncE
LLRTRRLAVALATCFLPLAGFAPPAFAARAYVVESDFASGSCSSVNATTHVSSCGVASVYNDARVRWYGGRVYVINRFGADNIQVLDGTTYALVKQFSVGNGSNPYDIAFTSPTHAYVARYGSADLWIVDPTTGVHTGTVSLASLADADGIPEMDHLIMVGPLLFVSLQRVDEYAGFQPTDSSLVAVVDTRTNALVDCDPAHPGVQGILLPRVNPVTPFVFDAPRTRLYLGCAGRYGVLDGGIVSLDPVGLAAAGVVATEGALEGDVLDLAWHDDARAYAIVSDESFNTALIRWSPVSGEREATLDAPGGFSLADAEVTPDGTEVWVCNASFESPGLRVFSTATGALIAGPLFCTLPPQGITFDTATGQVSAVAPRGAGLSFARPRPNPTRGPVRLAVAFDAAGDVRVEIADVSGRRIRGWQQSVAGAGALELEWDLRNDAGRRVPPGVYLVSVRHGTVSASRRVLVLR